MKRTMVMVCTALSCTGMVLVSGPAPAPAKWTDAPVSPDAAMTSAAMTTTPGDSMIQFIRSGCVECVLNEGEPDCEDGYVDVTNGGCNSSPPVFQPIECGQTVCGTSGTYVVAGRNYRDSDWFEMTTTEYENLHWTAVAEFPLMLIIMKGAGVGDCSGYTTVAGDFTDPCTELSVSALTATPGTYWFWVGPSLHSGVECGLRYQATLTCEPAEPRGACCHEGSGVCENNVLLDDCEGSFALSMSCEELIPPCGGCVDCELNEGEPDCADDYVDVTNGGCNSTPAVFQPIEFGQTICGTSGVYLYEGQNQRDTDWFEMTTTGLSDFHWTVRAEFPVGAVIMKGIGPGDCSGGYNILASEATDSCEELTVSAQMQEPGTYWFWVGANVVGVPCGSRYTATLTGGPAELRGACCNDAIGVCEDNVLLDDCEGRFTLRTSCDLLIPPCGGCITCTLNEGEPICGNEYTDVTNGGCNSSPSVFQPIACDQTICGTSGTYRRGGRDYRDSDWFEITTTQYYDLSWVVKAEFPVQVFIMKAAAPGDCSNSYGLATARGVGCAVVTAEARRQEPGTYWFCVTPTVYSGVECGAAYQATLHCVPVETHGACCNDATGACEDDVVFEACEGRFARNTLCEDMNPPCGGCPEDMFTLDLYPDGKERDTTWDVQDAEGHIVCSGGPYAQGLPFYREFCCLDADGCYTFTIYDAHGDGICCIWGNGHYTAYFNNEIIASGGAFGAKESSPPFGGGCRHVGDLDGDGDVDSTDAAIFVAVLLGQDTEPTHVAKADLDLSGMVNGLDIQPFVDALLGQ